MEGRFRLVLLYLFAVGRGVSTTGVEPFTAGGSGPSMFFYQDQVYPRDCMEVQDQCSNQDQNSLGAHLIRPDGYNEPFWVSCSGEWTVFQQRLDGFLDFKRNWTEYQRGFGYLNTEHWLGNEKLAQLTNQKDYELCIEIETKSGKKARFSYGRFRIIDEFSDYALVNLKQNTGNIDLDFMSCPANMIYGNCSRCIATCADPTGVVNCSNDCTNATQSCICPVNYVMDGGSCVRLEQCRCYKEGHGMIAETQITSDCTERCQCNSGVLICEPTACDCYDIWRSGNNVSGDYTITPSGWTGGPFTVNCNMTIDGGGWTVIQRHFQSSSRENFNQDWETYKVGFGTPSREFWIGNEKLFYLTNQKDYELRIDMVHYSYQLQYFAKYDFFRINGASDKYRMIGLGNHTGTAEFDAMRCHHYMYFSTRDQDNDYSGSNLASFYRGGWWYSPCDNCNMNTMYYGSYIGFWDYLPHNVNGIVYSEMKIRPKKANQ